MNQVSPPPPLLGRWIVDPSDEAGVKRFGNVTLEFKEGGKLIYTIRESGKDRIILLTYTAQEGLLITNQPSHPREEHTPFEIDDSGRLRLTYGSSTFSLVRDE